MILVVMPAFNEEAKIGRVIRGLFEHGYKDIVVVDDGSTDQTVQTAQKEGAKVLRHIFNRGQGAALETGNEYARRLSADLVVHFDADGQFDPADIRPAIEAMSQQGLDAILGSRFMDDRSKIPWFKKYLILPAGRVVNRFFCKVWLTDAHNGFRILNRNALNRLRISHDGMSHNSEILSALTLHDLKFAEIPVRVFYNEYGQGFLGGIKILSDLLLSKLIK